MSVLDCSADQCRADYDQICGVCEEHCPTGYTSNGIICYDSTASVDKLILHYGDFTNFTNADTDLVRGWVAYRGTNENYNDNLLDSENPRV